MNDKEFLMWVYERLVHVHGENPNSDYMHRFQRIIKSMEKESAIMENATAGNDKINRAVGENAESREQANPVECFVLLSELRKRLDDIEHYMLSGFKRRCMKLEDFTFIPEGESAKSWSEILQSRNLGEEYITQASFIPRLRAMHKELDEISCRMSDDFNFNYTENRGKAGFRAAPDAEIELAIEEYHKRGNKNYRLFVAPAVTSEDS